MKRWMQIGVLLGALLGSLLLGGCQQQACKSGHSQPNISITHDSKGTHVSSSSTYVCDQWYPPTDK